MNEESSNPDRWLLVAVVGKEMPRVLQQGKDF